MTAIAGVLLATNRIKSIAASACCALARNTFYMYFDVRAWIADRGPQ
jgi:hypothetical protein